MRRKILFSTAALSLLSSAPLLAQGKEANQEFASAAQEAAPAPADRSARDGARSLPRR